MHQLKLFTADTLPRKPYCTDNLGYLKIRPLAQALKHRYIQPNEPTRRHWLVYDIDREGAAEAWDGVVAEPNFTVVNPENGHAHLLYALDVPIYLQGNARIQPIRYAAAIDTGYTDMLGADKGFGGLICKNPTHRDWRVQVGPQWAYDLGGLAEHIPADILKKLGRRKGTMLSGLGRNCTLFNTLRLWSYRNINRTAWVSFDVWYRAISGEAEAINGQFPDPLPMCEVRAAAKSVAKWTWANVRGSQQAYIDSTHGSEVQAERGKRSGKARRKGTPLEHDPQPWLKEGVSRRTWYRRKQQQQTLFEGDTILPK